MTSDGESHPPMAVRVLQALLLFLAVSAIIPGGLLMIDPTGNLLKMPLEMLEYSPFNDFLIPGLILLTAIGIFPLLTAYGLARRTWLPCAERFNIDKNQYWPHTFSFYVGIILILWIDFEVMFLRSVALLHLIYSLLGVAIVVLSQIPSVRGYYKT